MAISGLLALFGRGGLHGDDHLYMCICVLCKAEVIHSLSTVYVYACVCTCVFVGAQVCSLNLTLTDTKRRLREREMIRPYSKRKCLPP
jgi:hypothetical protein